MKKIFSLACLVFLCTVLSYRTKGDARMPELPRVYLDTRLQLPQGKIINVVAGDNLQAAIDSAMPGDLLLLESRAMFIGNFVLPAKTGDATITISIEPNLITEAGDRIKAEHFGLLPKLISPNTGPALSCAPGANNYRLIGLEITTTANGNFGLLTIGSGNETGLDQLPENIIVDRCYIHGQSDLNVSRGIALNGISCAVIDSYISDCHWIGQDAQAICGWNGPGPFKIVNSYLEGAGENVLFGGSDPRIQNLVPSDIEFRQNHCFKPLSWYRFHPSYAGKHWTVKNLFELKNARRVLIEGNVFENNWVDGQNGTAILLTPRNQDGGSDWVQVEDVIFRLNIVKNTPGALNLLGRDYNHPSLQTRNIFFEHNLFTGIGASGLGTNGRFLQSKEINGLAVVNNTIIHTGNITAASGPATTDFVYENNISAHNLYGFTGDNTGVGNSALVKYYPGCVFTRNVLAGGQARLYPANNFFPATLADVGFADLANGDYRLSQNSLYRNAGTNGNDLGADIEALNLAINPPRFKPEVVLYASDVLKYSGNYVLVSDPSAANGIRIANPNLGAAKLTTPLAGPVSYFEISFLAEAGKPYHLWIRGKAENNFFGNDSVFVQFDKAVDLIGQPVWRTGTRSASIVNLEDGIGSGISGWGWQDNGYGIGVLGPNIYFSSTGLQTLRIQPREDGLSIDQVLLSGKVYLLASPGSSKSDATILPR